MPLLDLSMTFKCFLQHWCWDTGYVTFFYVWVSPVLTPCTAHKHRLINESLKLCGEREKIVRLHVRKESTCTCAGCSSEDAHEHIATRWPLSGKHWRVDRCVCLCIVAHCVSGPFSGFVGYENCWRNRERCRMGFHWLSLLLYHAGDRRSEECTGCRHYTGYPEKHRRRPHVETYRLCHKSPWALFLWQHHCPPARRDDLDV